MIEWIAYGHGWEFTSEDGAARDVPPFGTLGVATVDPDHGYELLAGKSYFAWSEGTGWDQHDLVGLIDRLAYDPGCIVRMGRSRPTAEYRRSLTERAAADMRLPRQSAVSRKERADDEVID